MPLIPEPAGSMSATMSSSASSGLTSEPHGLLERTQTLPSGISPSALGAGLRLSTSECLKLSNVEVKATPSASPRHSVQWVTTEAPPRGGSGRH